MLRGTATSCASPIVTNSVRGGKPGQSRSPQHPPPQHQRLPAQMLQTPRRLDAVDVPVSTRDKRGWSTDMLRASPLNATRPPAR
jgi:hypothetical protein